MVKSLKFKFLLAFLAVALGSVLFTGLLINRTVGTSFYDYMQKRLQTRNQELVDALTDYYKEYGRWEWSYCSSVARTALYRGAGLRIRDEKGGTVFWFEPRKPPGMRFRMNGNGEEYKEYTYPVTVDGEKVGEVGIGYYEPELLSPVDAAFEKRISWIMIAATVSAVILAVVGSIAFSSRLTGPISQIIDATGQMSKGDLKRRVPSTDREDELGELARSVNKLGEWVENLESMRRQMTADVAHELRTPLTTLQGHLEAIMDGVWDPTPERIAICHGEVVRLASLVKDIERLSSCENEAVRLNVTEFDVGDVIKEVYCYFESSFAEKNVYLNMNTGDSLVLKGDRDKIKQVVINLLSNALKYTPEGGEVKVEAYRAETGTVIQVQDTGKGISPEDLPFIFERFYRGDKSRSRSGGWGSGIGLAIVKAIVELHGGSVKVDSQPGKGSVFRVILPQTAAEARDSR